MAIDRVAVVGGGAWGTALAQAAAAAGRDVVLWMRDPERARKTEESRCNASYLPTARLDPRIRVTESRGALRPASAVLLVVPAQAVRESLQALAPHLGSSAPLVICAKGIERGSGLFLSDIAAELRPAAPVAVLSGPSFARDVVCGLPTAVTLACGDGETAAVLAAALSGPTFRFYHCTDVRGV
jgi:glycerol-3-phosphate dehydrogenase (NAD(P)+)